MIATPRRNKPTSNDRGKNSTQQGERGLDLLNFFLADVQTGVGPFLAIYLAGLGWSAESVGLALTVGGIAGIATQSPAGALVDTMRHKRTLIAIATAILALGALLIAFYPGYREVMTGQILIGGISSVFIPAVCAISLGLVGSKFFDARQGRNQAFNSAGNVVAAISMGLIGYFCSNRAIFFFVALLAIPTMLSLRLIDPCEIDFDRARGGDRNGQNQTPSKLRELLKNRPLVVLLICSVLFHFANAAMLPLLGEMLGKGKGRSSMMFMAACIVTTQIVVAIISSPTGRLASSWGRKRLLLIGFAVLPVRGLLYTFTTVTTVLIAIQILDGIGAGIFGVVSVLMIADLTKGTGRFNVTLGTISAAVGIGASMSQLIAGSIVSHFGYNAAFLFLALVAAAAVITLWVFMPETLDPKSTQHQNNDNSTLESAEETPVGA